MDLLRRAIIFATKHHAGQMRRWGEPPLPYISHPLSVTVLVAPYDNDSIALAAAVCHDVLEDTECTEEELEGEVGPYVTKLVKELTNVPLGVRRAEQKAADRKRIVPYGYPTHLIKACDRMHNLMTIEDAPEGFRKLYLEESRLLFDVLKASLPEKLRTVVRALLT